MTKIKIILTTMGILTIALTLNGYAMMGGGNGHGGNGDSGHDRYSRTGHAVTYNMAPGYYNQGAHMSDEEMASNHYRRYQHDRSMVNNNNYYRLRFEFNHRDRTQGYDYNHRQNRIRGSRNER